MTCLYLTEEDVGRLLDMPAAIDAMHEAFRALARGQADNVPRDRAQGQGIVLHSMSAAADYLGMVGWKQYTTTRRAARFLVGLHDQASGELRALIAADRLGQLRTGAVTGLAVRLLAPPDVDRLGLLGCGWQAESQLAAVAAARPVREARVYCRDAQRREAFAARMTERLAIDVQPVDAPRKAVEDQPIVVTATSSRQPVFEGPWLRDDALVCAIGSNWPHKTELDLDTIRRATRIVCDSVACCRREAGDLILPAEQGLLDWSQVAELKDLVAAEPDASEPGASEPDASEPGASEPGASGTGSAGRGGIRLFKSVGMALEDVALGSLLLKRARQAGAGRLLDLT